MSPDLKDALIKLLSMKRIIALALTLVFCYLIISKQTISNEFITIFSSIISFYFGQSTTRDAIQENKEHS